MSTWTTRAGAGAVALLCGIGGLTGCSGNDAQKVQGPRHFEVHAGDTRIIFLKEQTTSQVGRRVSLPKETTGLVFHLYCRDGTGPISANASGSGGASTGCRSLGASGVVDVRGDGSPVAPSGHVRVRVRAPHGATWTVSVDASTRTD